MNSPANFSRPIEIDNLSRIKAFLIDEKVISNPEARQRAETLIAKFKQWWLDSPFLLVYCRDESSIDSTSVWANNQGCEFQCHVLQKRRDSDTGRIGSQSAVGLALKVFKQRLGEVEVVKRHFVHLAWRGGKGKAKFVEPFTGGAGTTCAAWTPTVDRDSDGQPIHGFMKGVLTRGFCPVECPFCYLQSYQMDAMELLLNWEDLEEELRRDWGGYAYPINFSEIGGFVEYDRWFSAEDGTGSMVQYVIDACAHANVIPFFLTKIAYPRYLKFHGRVQVGISLLPEPVREVHAPNGSPANELLESLAWAWKNGAYDPVIRLFMLWEDRELYPELLARCKDLLGTTGWRITLDVPRFTPITAGRIAKEHPAAANAYAAELSPREGLNLAELAKQGHGKKKIRPPRDRQDEVYRWVRQQLDDLGCQKVQLTACKGDPDELRTLVDDRTILKMPCACHKSCGVTRLAQIDGV